MKSFTIGKIRGLMLMCLSTIMVFTAFSQEKNSLKGKKVLIFSATRSFRHASIGAGRVALLKLASEKGFQADTTENPANFNEKNLKQYKVVIFLNTTGNVFNDAQQNAFERYIQAGGAYMGIHAATDTEHDWPWYTKLSGGEFMSHPGRPNVQMGRFNTVDNKHISTAHMPASFEHKDEFYDYKNFNTDVKVLVTVDEKSYKDGKMGDFHPMSWYHEYDGGRSFYMNWGHTDESFSEPLVYQHMWGGLLWAGSGPDINYNKKLRTGVLPEDNRFTKTILDQNLNEPTELTVLPNGKVLYTERRGNLKMYDPKKNKSKIVAKFDVYSKSEYGLMGINKDPNYAQNNWIYVYYSPQAGLPDTAQHLSRFVYNELKDTLDWASEKVLLRVPVKRDGKCCHTGGSIAWDKQGNLYLSTGDDVNPHESNGFGPMDERPGRAGWDARASSSNTNDLRGKILRIKPQADGTYTIPEGNLFPPNFHSTKSEIYIMGNRNPYRISVDQRTGFLYWGEVGPDAGENSPKYGPRGHDEVNQAREAGYFGWPLFVGDNKAYNQRKFANDSTWAPFNPLAPINTSAHNTGLGHLPKAQKAFIYYPYADSPEFGATIGKGSRNAMAGPVYYSSDYPADSKSKFPSFYDGKLFAYDWARDLVYTVSMKQNGDFLQMDRFLPGIKFNHPMEMEFDHNGVLYGLEYGPNWFAQNEEATLYKIEYNPGNRTPKVAAVADKKAGAVPLKVKFSSEGTIDYDGDKITYNWNFGNGMTSPAANPTVTFTKPGKYNVVLTVKDAKGNSKKETIAITAGNEVPKVSVEVEGNKSFYWNDKPVKYAVKVEDKEDGTLDNKKVAEDDVLLSIDYLQGFDKNMIALGHQSNTSFSNGLRLIDQSDCKTCHAKEKKSIGPSYKDISKKYRAGSTIIAQLASKIIAGGGGVWGEQAMAAHPQISNSDAREMVQYILSLGDAKKASKPLKGEYVPKDGGKPGTYIFTASYTDKGNGKIAPVLGQGTVTLRSATIPAAATDATNKIMKMKMDNVGELVIANEDKSHVVYKGIDLTGIKAIKVTGFVMEGTTVGGRLEVHLGSPEGPLVGTGEFKKAGAVTFPVNSTEGVKDLYMVFRNENAGGKPLFAITEITFQ
jgi:cytochrome c